MRMNHLWTWSSGHVAILLNCALWGTHHPRGHFNPDRLVKGQLDCCLSSGLQNSSRRTEKDSGPLRQPEFVEPNQARARSPAGITSHVARRVYFCTRAIILQAEQRYPTIEMHVLVRTILPLMVMNEKVSMQYDLQWRTYLGLRRHLRRLPPHRPQPQFPPHLPPASPASPSSSQLLHILHGLSLHPLHTAPHSPLLHLPQTGSLDHRSHGTQHQAYSAASRCLARAQGPVRRRGLCMLEKGEA
jgi:hypothetical protein